MKFYKEKLRLMNKITLQQSEVERYYFFFHKRKVHINPIFEFISEQRFPQKDEIPFLLMAGFMLTFPFAAFLVSPIDVSSVFAFSFMMLIILWIILRPW